jgi:hypothetical protein
VVNDNNESASEPPSPSRNADIARNVDSFYGGVSSASRAIARAADAIRERFFAQEITVYPTYGYRDPAAPATWRVPIRVWVHDNRDTPFVESAIERWAARYFAEDMKRPLDDAEKGRVAKVLAPFIADDKQNESVELTFGHDRTVFRLEQRTTQNGVIEEIVELPDAWVQQILGDRTANDVWCEIHARTRDGNGAGIGAVRFLQPEGVSVISDIDDTLKITHVPAGKRTVLRNTFLREFRAADGMRERFRGIVSQAPANADVGFHYVSGGPWQLFAPLYEFLIEEQQFPRGTFHMKNLRKNLFESGAVQTIIDFGIAGDLATLDQKIRQITALMIHFPRRKFILVGDSGEKDPEVYHAIRKLFPDQVIRILIRDVLADRLSGMELITGHDVSVSFDTTELDREMERLVAASRPVAAHTDQL